MLKDCPRCYRLLEEIRFEGLRVDVCPGCGGIWLDQADFVRLAQSGMGAFQRLEERGRSSGFWTRRPEARCPNCRVPLARFALPQAPEVELDGCRECRGIWVDDTELRALSESFGRMARAAGAPAGPAGGQDAPARPAK